MKMLFRATVSVVAFVLLGVKGLLHVRTSTRAVVPSCTRLFGVGGLPMPAPAALNSGAQKKMYDDLVAAQTRRANLEKELLGPPVNMVATNVAADVAKPASGTGFSAKNAKTLLAEALAKVLQKDGVIRIDGGLCAETAEALRIHILTELESDRASIAAGALRAEDVLGTELDRKSRTDYLLSFGPPTKAAAATAARPHPVAAALNELFGDNGKLRLLYETIITKKGLLYELACMTTFPGSDRQVIHSDYAYQDEPALYSIFVALQDVTMAMGPTTFLPGTNNRADANRFKDKGTFDDYLQNKTPHVALLKAGDLVCYDPRVLHCGAENQPDSGNVRAMFTVGFRNPRVTKDFGWKGSLRTAYSQKITLGDVTAALSGYDASSARHDPFAKWGNGLWVVDGKGGKGRALI